MRWMTDVLMWGLFTWLSVQDAYFSVKYEPPYSEMQPVQANKWGCLIVEVQSNIQMTRWMLFSSWGTFKPVPRQVSNECVSDHDNEGATAAFQLKPRQHKLDGLYLGQQYYKISLSYNYRKTILETCIDLLVTVCVRCITHIFPVHLVHH